MQSRSTHVLTADAFEFALTINVAAGRGQADFKDPYLRICNFRAQGVSIPPGFSRVAGSSVGELISSGNWRVVCRIKPLCRLRCCALVVCGYGEGGREATEISTPLPRPPGFSRVAGSQVGTIAGRRSATARRRVAHQALVPPALLRVSCLRIRRGRARGLEMARSRRILRCSKSSAIEVKPDITTVLTSYFQSISLR